MKPNLEFPGRERLEELLLESRTRTLSTAEREEINAILRADEVARSFAAQTLMDDAALAEELRAEQMKSLLAADSGGMLGASQHSPTAARRTWLSWRPLTAAAAGIVFGMFCTSMVFGLVSRQQASVQTLLMEGFEDAAMILGRGVPTSVGVWSGDLLATVEAKVDVMPAEGDRMLVMQPQEGRTQSSAYRFLDLTSLPPASAGQSRQIEVTIRFYGGKPGVRSRLRMRLTAFAEEVAEARQLFFSGSVPELALAHVEKSDGMKAEAWNTVRLAIDVPVEARVLLVSMVAGLHPPSALMPERYLDDVQIRLITQKAPLP